MSKQSLAVKYRPQRFDDVVEQDVIKSILGEQLKNKTFKNVLLFCGGAGTGKAQPLWSKVLTPDGFITMKEVSVGTKVITGEGNIATVTEVYPQGKKDVYCITLNSKTYRAHIHVADNHLNVINVNDTDQVVTTTELITILNNEKITHIPVYMYVYDEITKTKSKVRLLNVSLVQPQEECKCIYVDAPEHTYITDNYVITHNTTSARIFANEINNFKGHVIEIDAASNNSVEHARKIIEEAKTQALDSEYKVFVLDECVTGETEILTDKGFKQIKNLDKTEKIAQYNDVADTIEFVTPLEYIEMPYEGIMYDFHSHDFSVRMSPHHVQCTCILDKDTHKKVIQEEYIEDFIARDDKYIMSYEPKTGKIGELYSTALIEKTPVNYNGTIYCVKVPTQKIIIRSGNFAFVTGNCHMLSNAAWNAMLKLIEEPPKKSIIVMATTDPQKIPATIISRVQRYQFQKISYEGIVSRLKYIIGEENKEEGNNITFEDSALEYIAKQADGGMRDAITLLDKAIGYSQELTIQNVLTALGSVSYETMFKLSTALDKMDSATVISVIEEVHGSGMDLKQFMKNYNYFVLDLCKYKLFKNFQYLQIPSIYENLINQYDNNSFNFFNELLNELLKLNDKLKWETLPKPLVESTLLNLCSEA